MDEFKNLIEIQFDPNEEETCVDCGIGLGYSKKTPIELRFFYTEVNGDRCGSCFFEATDSPRHIF